LVDIWKENLLEDMEVGEVQFASGGDFLIKLRREFGGGDDESAKVAELKRVE